MRSFLDYPSSVGRFPWLAVVGVLFSLSTTAGCGGDTPTPGNGSGGGGQAAGSSGAGGAGGATSGGTGQGGQGGSTGGSGGVGGTGLGGTGGSGGAEADPVFVQTAMACQTACQVIETACPDFDADQCYQRCWTTAAAWRDLERCQSEYLAEVQCEASYMPSEITCSASGTMPTVNRCIEELNAYNACAG